MMSPEFWYSLPVLTGRRVRLEPLSLEHGGGYLAAAGTGSPAEQAFRFAAMPDGRTGMPRTVAEAIGQVAALLAARAAGQVLPYVLLDAGTGRLVGISSFCRVRPAARSIGIEGWSSPQLATELDRSEASLLMLTYVFDALSAVRVSWQLASADAASRAALESFGARLEGVLRKHRCQPDGPPGDTALYAMIDDDWPLARKRLAEQVAG